MALAQDETRRLGHDALGAGHILLGLVRVGDGVAAEALASLGISLDDARAQVDHVVGPGRGTPLGHLPLTPQAKQALIDSHDEAFRRGHDHIDTEHVLLGLLREADGVATQVLGNLGVDRATARQRVIELLPDAPGRGPTARTTAAPVPTHALHTPGRGGGGPASCSFCGRDLWDVDHYVTGNAADICAACIVAAHEALAAATEDDPPRLTLPPRVFGNVPADAPASVAGIVDTLLAVFGAEVGEATAAFLEDGAQLVPVIMEFRSRVPDLHVAEVVIERIRFTTPTAASVGFTLVLNGGARFPFVGTVIRPADRWIVTRTTIGDVIGRGGGRLPHD
jgi:hypothetical protein